MHGTKGEMVPVFVLSNVILEVTEGTQGGKKISLFQLSQMYIAGEIRIKLIYLRLYVSSHLQQLYRCSIES